MSPGERKLIDFIATRLESMFRRPAVWGSDSQVEVQVLQLLEMRRLLLNPAANTRDTWQLMRPYVRFIATIIPEATPEPLAVQLENRGRGVEFTDILRRFADQELTKWVVEVRDASVDAGVEHGLADQESRIEPLSRLIALLRTEAAAEARSAPRAKREAIHFPPIGKN